MKLLVLLRSLEHGGAERQAVTLARALHARGRDVVVVAFYAGGALLGDLRDAGVRTIVLGKRGRWDLLPFLVRLIGTLRREAPRVVYSYLVLPNVLAVLLRPVLRRARVAWGLRGSAMDLSRYGWPYRLGTRLERLLARGADVIVVNSRAGLEHAASRGFPRERMVVVPNGIDVARFRPDPASGRAVRAQWGVPSWAPLVGLVGRLDPMKDHETFLGAARAVRQARGDAWFACVGGGPPGRLRELEALAAELGLGACVVFAGEREDMPSVYSALTACVSSSAFGEGFSNVLGEAQACGVPAVATDVGDARLVVGDEAVVPPRDPAALARACLDVLALREREGEALSQRLRERIAREFSVEAMAARTEAALGLPAAGTPGTGARG